MHARSSTPLRRQSPSKMTEQILGREHILHTSGGRQYRRLRNRADEFAKFTHSWAEHSAGRCRAPAQTRPSPEPENRTLLESPVARRARREAVPEHTERAGPAHCFRPDLFHTTLGAGHLEKLGYRACGQRRAGHRLFPISGRPTFTGIGIARRSHVQHLPRLYLSVSLSRTHAGDSSITAARLGDRRDTTHVAPLHKETPRERSSSIGGRRASDRPRAGVIQHGPTVIETSGDGVPNRDSGDEQACCRASRHPSRSFAPPGRAVHLLHGGELPGGGSTSGDRRDRAAGCDHTRSYRAKDPFKARPRVALVVAMLNT